MKRDMDLIRRILFAAEAGEPIDQLSNVDRETLMGHLVLLSDAGLVVLQDVSDSSGDHYWLKWITWEGYEFLEAARNDSVWAKAKAKLKEKALGVTFAVLKQLLKNEIQERTGIEID